MNLSMNLAMNLSMNLVILIVDRKKSQKFKQNSILDFSKMDMSKMSKTKILSQNTLQFSISKHNAFITDILIQNPLAYFFKGFWREKYLLSMYDNADNDFDNGKV